jgi:site-specific DNA-methyltransferase (adenine-specific)
MRTLFYGDNLEIMRKYLKDETVDLIYLDPPFNSKADYNLLFKEESGERSVSQIKAFTDFWHWDLSASTAYYELMHGNKTPSNVSTAIEALVRLLGQNDMSAYLVMMAIRLLEMRRILKSTGSIYLHCDPTASHYLKIVIDSIFGPENFKNEIIWRRHGSNNSANRFGPIHQTILFYGKSKETIYYHPKGPYTNGYVHDFFTKEDQYGRFRLVPLTGAGVRSGESGKEWRGYNPTNGGRHWAIPEYLKRKYRDSTGKTLDESTTQEQLDLLDSIGMIYWGKDAKIPNYKFYLRDAEGAPLQDIWAYQPGTEGCVFGNPDVAIDQDVMWLTGTNQEILGYPTQKPLGLLERIIRASSKEGDVVFDPFCGCGTTVHAAQKLGRDWIGIDITHLAINLVRNRLQDAFRIKVEVEGEPRDLEGAKNLAIDDRFQFQWWALSLVGARPFGGERKKGPDRGIDGVIYNPKGKNESYYGIVQVKSGHVKSGDIRDFRGTTEREKADYGIFISLENSTDEMRREAMSAGFLKTVWDENMQKIQILTIEELMNGRKPDLPSKPEVFEKARKEKTDKDRSGGNTTLD